MARKPAPPRRTQTRTDGLDEAIRGRGRGSAPARSGRLRLLPTEAEDIYTTSGVAARIVNIIPEEVTRCGFTIETEADFDHDEFRSWWETIKGDAAVTQAMIYSRLYGGGAIMVLSATEGDDLQPWRASERPGQLRPVASIELNERDTGKWDDIELGMPEQWNLSPMYGGTDIPVHNSRLLKFPGRPQPVSWRMNGAASERFFGLSCLQGITDEIQDYEDCHAWASLLLKRLQQGVWYGDGIADACETVAGERGVHRRLALVDGIRSAASTIAVDKALEDYKLLQGNLNGVKDLLSEKKARLSNSTGIPAIVLAGDTSGGLNNSAAGALQSWVDTIARYQNFEATPVVSQLVAMQYPDLKNFKISWNPITEETPAERADRLQKESAADAAYVTNYVLSAEEVRETLQKRGDYKLAGKAPEPPTPTITAPTEEDANPQPTGDDE